MSLVSALIGGLVRDSALSGLDRSLGLVFGVVRGALIVCLAYIALSVGVAGSEWPAPGGECAVSALGLSRGDDAGRVLAEAYQPKVDPLPGAPAPSAGTLMQQPVAGSALRTE